MTTERVVLASAGVWVALVLAAVITAPVTTSIPASTTTAQRAQAVARHHTREVDAPARVVAASAIFDVWNDTDVLGVWMMDAVVPERVAAASSRDVPVATLPASLEGGTRAAELATLDLINASRAAGGLRPLSLDARVSATARAHSEVESAHGYVYHDGADGMAHARDAAACGTAWYGENTGKVWDENVARLHREFMAEPWEPINHRTNIMDPAFTRVGIGAVQGRDAMYLTMVFCR